jgi:crotonobetainyl-CoA:carnitine CoA-transferase CaiB-like acyl-CoA transferase
VVAMIVAFDDARRTGQGHHIESVMVEASINCAAEQIVEFTAYGARLTRAGNRSPEAAPQGLYACRGHECWLAVSIATDDQWWALRSALGEPAWALDPALDTRAGRHAAHDVLDEHLAAWAAEQDVDDAAERLVAAGVPAVAAWDPRQESAHPLLVARRFYEEVAHPVVGTHPVPGLPFRWTGIDRWSRTAAPTLGQHNRQVLTGILGVPDAEVDALAAAGIIGNRAGG